MTTSSPAPAGDAAGDLELPTLRRTIERWLAAPALAAAAAAGQITDDLIPGSTLDRHAFAAAAAAAVAAAATRAISQVAALWRRHRIWSSDGPTVDGCSGPTREWAEKGLS